MSEYCTIRDVRLALTPGAVSDDNNQTGATLPDWQIEDAILEAEGIVRAYLTARYTIPSTEVEEVNPENPLETWVWFVAPSPVRGWCRDIAAYLCALTFRKNKDLPEDDPIRLRFLMVMGMLKDVRDYNMDLPGVDFPPAPEDTTKQGVHVENLYEGRLFSMEDFGLGYEGHVRAPQVFWPVTP